MLPQSLMETLQRMSESPEGEVVSQGMGYVAQTIPYFGRSTEQIVNAYETAAAVKEEAAGQGEKFDQCQIADRGYSGTDQSQASGGNKRVAAKHSTDDQQGIDARG